MREVDLDNPRERLEWYERHADYIRSDLAIILELNLKSLQGEIYELQTKHNLMEDLSEYEDKILYLRKEIKR